MWGVVWVWMACMVREVVHGDERAGADEVVGVLSGFDVVVIVAAGAGGVGCILRRI